jgi:hypothetical protein
VFDAVIAVDWSANSRPKRGRDSIWIGETGRAPENVPTRADATRIVRDRLVGHLEAGRRVLVGFDFPYGYPRGFADGVFPGPGPAWRRVWDGLAGLVQDEANNRNNRFAVATELNARLGEDVFWGAGHGVPSRRATRPVRELRQVEAELRERGGQPKTVWQLSYAGCVGSQALLGIPRVRALRDDVELEAASAVWPFEDVSRARIVHAEIWPSLWPLRVSHPVKDAAQVETTVLALLRADDDGLLVDRDAEEGWILGA